MGQIGGQTQAVAVAGDYAYVGVGSRLAVLDVSNPVTLHEIGSSQPFGSYVEDVSLSQETAFVAAGSAGFYIVDVSDPIRTAIIANYDTPGYTEGLAVLGAYAYVADGPDGLRVFDITDRTHPVEVSAAFKSSYAFDVAIEGRYGFVAAAGSGLLVADVSDPRQPKEVGSLDTPGYAFSVAISEGNAYVADGWAGLQVINISVPTQPTETSSYETSGWALDVVTVGNTAYLADAFNALQILDISAPTKPTAIGSYDMLGDHIGSLAIRDGVGYLTSWNVGMNVLDLTTPARPVRIGAYNPMGFADAVAISGSYAYVAAGSYGLRIIDVTDLSRPREVGFYDTGSYAAAVIVEGDYAYVITYSSSKFPGGLHVVDVSNPALPTRASFLENAGGQDIVVSSGIAYIADEWGIRLIDVTNPVALAQLSAMDFAQGDHAKATIATWGVAVSDQMAYVAHQDAGLKIVNVSDPLNPDVAVVYKSGAMNKPTAVAVGGKTLYLVDNPWLLILDITDPTNPIEVGTFELPITAERITFANDRLYVADSAAGLVVLDVSDPHQPTIAGWRRLPGYASGISAADHYIYVADGRAGIYIIEDTAQAGQADLASVAQHRDTPPTIETVSFPPIQAAKSIYSVRDEPAFLPALRQHVPYNSNPQAAFIAPVSFQPRIKTLTVTSTADSGLGTLRWAIENATHGDTIIFDPAVFPPGNPSIIYPLTGLPGLQAGQVTLDASNAGVILDGSRAAAPASGLDIMSDHNTIRGLQIVNFTGRGISIRGAGNTIGGDRSNGTGPLGQGNRISGNEGAGVLLEGLGTVDNQIIGNLIGTDLSGKNAFGNKINGVFIGGGASRNTIGGTTETERNVISGNVRTEVSIFEQANANSIAGNYIGTDTSGRARVGDAVMGISIELGGFNNVIQGNVVGNSVVIADWGSWGNSIIGNFVGVDATGTVALGGHGGVSVTPFNRIGGTASVERNVISGCGGPGIALSGLGTNIIIMGNYIGTDVTGTKALGNHGNGIVFYQGVQHAFIGGPSLGEGNLISGNQSNGISLEGFGNDDNFIIRNFIGTGVGGMIALPNMDAGILIGDGDRNFIQGNLIANHEPPGVHIMNGDNNLVHHNSFINNGGNDGGTGNHWDDGSEGNYWSDYQGLDANEDGIGDTPYPVPSSGVDNYPLMKPTVFLPAAVLVK